MRWRVCSESGFFDPSCFVNWVAARIWNEVKRRISLKIHAKCHARALKIERPQTLFLNRKTKSFREATANFEKCKNVNNQNDFPVEEDSKIISEMLQV